MLKILQREANSGILQGGIQRFRGRNGGPTLNDRLFDNSGQLLLRHRGTRTAEDTCETHDAPKVSSEEID